MSPSSVTRTGAPTRMTDDNPKRTYHEQAIQDAAEGQGGRWRKNTEVSVAGTGPIPHASVLVGPAWSDDVVPPEESLGFEVDALPSMLTVSGFPPEEPQPTEEGEQP